MGRKAKYATLSKYQPFIDVILKDLDLIGKVEIEFVFGSWKKKGGDAWTAKEPLANGKYFSRVRIDKHASHVKTLSTIMHELRHVWQRVTETMSYGHYKNYTNNRGRFTSKFCRYWMGEEYEHVPLHYDVKGYQKYLNLPWEVDARTYAEKHEQLFPDGKIKQETKKLVGSVGKVKFYKIAS